MASHRGRSTSPRKNPRPQMDQSSEDDSILNSRQLEAFSRTVHATASQLITGNFATHDAPGQEHYRNALSSVRQFSRRPAIQRSVFSFAKANPRELIRSNFNTSEIEHRALTHLPDDLLRNVPESQSTFSLFEGFKASLPDHDEWDRASRRQRSGRTGSRGQKLLEGPETATGPPKLVKLRREKAKLEHRLEMTGVRKSMCTSEIREIDNKIANLNTMRKVIMDRLAGLEDEERELEHSLGDAADRLDILEEELEDEIALAEKSPASTVAQEETPVPDEVPSTDGAGFMSESIYDKLPKTKESPPKPKRRKTARKISMPVLHEHMEPGSRIRELQAHNDMITAVDFDAPFGTMVTAALDDTVRVWDLNAGRCMGMLEGHLSSVRCLQVEETLVATGSMDASIRLWDLGQADYIPPVGNSITSKPADESNQEPPVFEDDVFTPATEIEQPSLRHANATANCHLFTLEAHVAEITALHFRGSTLVSGSADKTLRQWDLEKGRCVQTLDVLWAAAQASATVNPISSGSGSGSSSINTPGLGGPNAENGGWWRPTGGRLQSAEADFVGALQVFDAALACGTADGMVRLWDLRSGMVHRSLVGHTGPVTALQFDDVYLVTGSRDRSIRIWDLRTGNIHDAFAYDSPISSMQFDARRIVAAAGEDVVKVYDKTDGRQWDCGAGAMVPGGDDGEGSDPPPSKASVVERVKIKDGYLVEGRRDGVVGVWSC